MAGDVRQHMITMIESDDVEELVNALESVCILNDDNVPAFLRAEFVNIEEQLSATGLLRWKSCMNRVKQYDFRSYPDSELFQLCKYRVEVVCNALVRILNSWKGERAAKLPKAEQLKRNKRISASSSEVSRIRSGLILAAVVAEVQHQYGLFGSPPKTEIVQGEDRNEDNRWAAGLQEALEAVASLNPAVSSAVSTGTDNDTDGTGEAVKNVDGTTEIVMRGTKFPATLDSLPQLDVAPASSTAKGFVVSTDVRSSQPTEEGQIIPTVSNSIQGTPKGSSLPQLLSGGNQAAETFGDKSAEVSVSMCAPMNVVDNANSSGSQLIHPLAPTCVEPLMVSSGKIFTDGAGNPPPATSVPEIKCDSGTKVVKPDAHMKDEFDMNAFNNINTFYEAFNSNNARVLNRSELAQDPAISNEIRCTYVNWDEG